MLEKNVYVPKKPLGFLWEISKPHRVPAVLAILSIIIAASTGAFVPYLFKRIIDTINKVEGLGPENVWFWVTLYIVFGFVGAVMWRVSGFAGMRWGLGVRATSRKILSRYVTKHSYSFFSDRFAGAIASKINNASEGVKHMVDSILWGWGGFFVQLAIGLWLVFYTNLYVGSIFLVWIIVITPINIRLVRKKIPLGVQTQETETKLRGHTVDLLTNITAMHDYARRAFELENLHKLIDTRYRTGLKNWMFSEWVLFFNSVIETVFVAGMIFTTLYLWNTGVITAGDVILVLSLLLSIRADIAFLGNNFNHTAEVLSETEEGLAEILREHEIVDSPFASKLHISEGGIIFDDVSFKYELQQIFSNLNLAIASGERVGLVGRSGAGKSTMMKLLMRQYDIQSGKILIDGQNIALVTQESLRESIAVVPQDPLLFHRSIMENIRYGRLSTTDEEVVSATKLAKAHEFIDMLPSKYETLVGERGVKLSGGERQRVAIARAFLKNAKILLLDEATSSLDSESELSIQKALQKLMKEKTVIAIAHRLSTLRAMDRIIVLDNGVFVEDGTHDKLLKLGGIYAELWSHQAGGFLQDE